MPTKRIRLRNIVYCFSYDSHVDLDKKRNAEKRDKILYRVYGTCNAINSVVHYQNLVLQQVHAQLNPDFFVFCQHYCCNAFIAYKKRK
jgi:hypothetical protein